MGKKACKGQKGQGQHKQTNKKTLKPTNLVHRGSQGLTQGPAWDWPKPSAYMLSLCKLVFLWHSKQSRGCFPIWCLLLRPIPLTGLSYPALIQKEEPSITAIWHTMAGWCPWEACLNLKRSNAGGVDEWRNREESKEGKLLFAMWKQANKREQWLVQTSDSYLRPPNSCTCPHHRPLRTSWLSAIFR